jgi:hypothetical protein
VLPPAAGLLVLLLLLLLLLVLMMVVVVMRRYRILPTRIRSFSIALRNDVIIETCCKTCDNP